MSSIIWLLFWYSDILLGLFREGPTLYGMGVVRVAAAGVGRCGPAGRAGRSRHWGCSAQRLGRGWRGVGLFSGDASQRCSMECPHGCAALGAREVFDGMPAWLCWCWLQERCSRECPRSCGGVSWWQEVTREGAGGGGLCSSHHCQGLGGLVCCLDVTV